MFVKKVFHLIWPFLANLHLSSPKNTHICTHPIIFLHMSIKNTQNFTLILNDWKKVYMDKVICQKLLQVRRGQTLILHSFLQKFLHRSY
jgi:hypothetical protein